jgi:hypothetical protein
MRANGLYAILLLAVPIAVAQSNTAVWRNGGQEKMCGLGAYHDSLDLAFKNATAGEGETLITLQVLPSFQREYALVLKRVGPEVKMLRTTLQKQLWTQLGPPLSVARTRQQCLEIARAAETDTVPVPVSAEQANSLWTTFSSTNLQTDICARQKRQCALIHDGTQYVIQMPDDRSFRLTEVEGMKGIVSENGALLDWVHTVLRVAQRWQEPPLSP